MEKEVNKQLKFLMFENEKNVCWLDASISLVAHNRTFKKIVESSPESQINKIISAYNEAIAVYNNSDSEQRIPKTKKILLAIQNSTLNYLKQFLKFKPGEPDSAFCALLNLIYQDKSNIKEYLNVSWIWRKECSNCGVNSKSVTCLKPIITLSKVYTFHPQHPSSIYVCACKSEEEMKLIYKELPPCLIFHFEKGIDMGNHVQNVFTIKGREYQLTSLVILEKKNDLNVNHFVTFIRNPFFNMWLECNDLNPDSVSFSRVKPEYDLKDVYMAVFEAFDSLDKITNDDILIDQDQDVENSNVELIDLSDEENGTKNIELCCKTKDLEFSEENQNEKATNFSERSSDINASKKELSGDKKEKSSITAQNLEICSSEQSTKSENFCNVSKQSVSVLNLKEKRKIFLNIPKNFDPHNKAASELIGTRKLGAEETDYPEHKNTKTVEEHAEISTSENLEMYGNENSKESYKINSENVPANSTEHAAELKSNNLDYQEKNIDDTLEIKDFEAEASNPKHKITDMSVKNEKNSNSLDSNIFTENITSDISQREALTVKKSISPISFTEFGKISDIRESKNKKSEDDKLLKMLKQIPLKKNENKHDNSNKEENINDQTASTSFINDETMESILQKSKRAYPDSDSSRKKMKMSDSKICKIPEKSKVEIPKARRNPSYSYANISRENKEKIKKMVDFHVNRSLAAFFGEIIKIDGKK